MTGFSPVSFDDWMRSIQRRVVSLERHRHPSSDAEVADLQAQVDALVVEVEALETDVATLQGDVAALQGDVAALQADVADLQDDSGWILLTGISSIWTNSTRYRKIGSMVTIRLNVQLTGLTSSTASYTFGSGSLPAEYRPVDYFQYGLAANTTANDRSRQWQVQPDGLVGFVSGSTVSENEFLVDTMTYPAG